MPNQWKVNNITNKLKATKGFEITVYRFDHNKTRTHVYK